MNKLFSSIYQYLKKHLIKGNARTVLAKKNIVGSIFIKGGSIAVSLVMVPLTIDYINPTRYGIWLALSSIVGWFSFFNVGMTHGLRNKFAEARTRGDNEAARMYISTTYAVLTIVFSAVWLVFLIVNPFLDWVNILNASSEMRMELSILAIIIFTYFCLQFVLKIINTLVTADQQPAKASLINFFGQIISLLVIVVLVKTTEGSLINLGMALCVAPVAVLIFANIYFFKTNYKNLKPSISHVNFSQSKNLFSLGLVFFVIQIASLVQYQTSNIIIAQSFGPYQVTTYNVVYKYFNVLGMGFGIFLTPFWSASTDAFFKNDISWIKKATIKYLQIGVLFVLAGVVMLFISDTVYTYWLKGKVDIDFTLSIWGLVFFSSFMFASIFVNFLNGISALKIQFWASLISPVIFVASAYLLIDYYGMGVHALFISSLIASFNGIIIAPLQYYFIIYRKKKGIWIR
ncbi:MATE family efflux transporter [uncultured Cyclobacterium sp.]|uniref:MATE family efflux transporter n=1 Tax=uncultured Cyclobacterium sp. TaxID=453820 RepID=UPI0030ED4D60|tara:strand:- start:206297 stop:207673 length:1377 start_codon:yes stop_codon:yes gene_type:complete